MRVEIKITKDECNTILNTIQTFNKTDEVLNLAYSDNYNTKTYNTLLTKLIEDNKSILSDIGQNQDTDTDTSDLFLDIVTLLNEGNKSKVRFTVTK